MHKSRSALPLLSRLGTALAIPFFGSLLVANWVGQQMPSLSVAYFDHDSLMILDIDRSLEIGLPGEYELSFRAPGLTPASSPDKQWMAAMDGDDGVQIFDLAQRTRTLLPLAFGQPIWSPDSRYVATMSLHGGRDMNIQSNAVWMTIQVADVRSGAVHSVAPPYQYLRILSMGWSADNQQITFVAMTTPTPDYTFYRVNIDGSDFHELDCAVSSGGMKQLSNFSFAPGAKKVAFSAPYDGPYHLYILDFDDCSQSRISDLDRYDDGAQWSPDGTRIAFLSAQGGQMDIYVMDSDGQHVSQLTDTPEHDALLSWSPDSQRLLFVAYGSSAGVASSYYADLRDNSLHLIDQQRGYTRSFATWGP